MMKPSEEFYSGDLREYSFNGLVAIVAGMAERINELSPKETEKPWPQDGDKIHWIPLIGAMATDWFDPSNPIHKGVLAAGLASPTREGAKSNYAWLTSPVTQARRRIEGLDGYNVKGDCALKWHDRKSIIEIINIGMGSHYEGGVSFNTILQAEAALATHPQDVELVLGGGE